MAEKQTSPEVSSIAGRVLASGSPLDSDDYRQPLRALAPRLGISDRAVEEILIPELAVIFEPVISDLRTLAASALSQDEKA